MTTAPEANVSDRARENLEEISGWGSVSFLCLISTLETARANGYIDAKGLKRIIHKVEIEIRRTAAHVKGWDARK